jgi:hypothetical protein
MASYLPSSNNTELTTALTVPAPGQEYWHEVHDHGIMFLLVLTALLLVTVATIAFIIGLLCGIRRFTSEEASPPGFVKAGKLVANALPVVLAPCATVKSNICIICLSIFQAGECIHTLSTCNYTHSFHVACMDILLKDHNKCIDCHTLMAEPSGKGKAIEEP